MMQDLDVPEQTTSLNEPDIDALYRAEQRRAQALAAIGAASREIAGSADFQGTLRLVMQKAAETLPMDSGVLFLIDEASGQFEVAVSHNLIPQRAARIRIAAHEGVPGWVVDHKAPLISENAAADRRVHPLVVKEGVHGPTTRKTSPNRARGEDGHRRPAGRIGGP